MNTETLVFENIDLIENISRGMARRFYPYYKQDDIYQDGFLGLWDAAKRYDPDRVDSFRAYAILRITGSIIDSFRKQFMLNRKKRILRQDIQFEKLIHIGVKTNFDRINSNIDLDRYLGRVRNSKTFTKREKEVVNYMFIQGITRAEMAQKLGIKTKVVDLYLHTTRQKIKSGIGGLP